MQLLGTKSEGMWATYGYNSTFNMSWDMCLAYTRAIYQHTVHPEILTAPIIGAGEKPIEIQIDNIDDIWNIPEAGTIVIRGNNDVYEGCPMQFRFVNQLRQVQVSIPQECIDNFKDKDGNSLNDFEKEHFFDRFIDSVEINGEAALQKRKDMIEMKRIIRTLVKDKNTNYFSQKTAYCAFQYEADGETLDVLDNEIHYTVDTIEFAENIDPAMTQEDKTKTMHFFRLRNPQGLEYLAFYKNIEDLRKHFPENKYRIALVDIAKTAKSFSRENGCEGIVFVNGTEFMAFPNHVLEAMEVFD